MRLACSDTRDTRVTTGVARRDWALQTTDQGLRHSCRKSDPSIIQTLR